MRIDCVCRPQGQIEARLRFAAIRVLIARWHAYCDRSKHVIIASSFALNPEVYSTHSNREYQSINLGCCG